MSYSKIQRWLRKVKYLQFCTDTWPVAKTRELFTRRTYRPSLYHSSNRSLSLWKFRMLEITFTSVNWMPSKLIIFVCKKRRPFPPPKIWSTLKTIEWFVFVREALKLDFVRVFFSYIFPWNKRIFHRKTLQCYRNWIFHPSKICLIFMDRRS